MSPHRGGGHVADRASRGHSAPRAGVRAAVYALTLAALFAAPTPALAQDQLGGGWTKVRHTPSGDTGHPATDQLAGTDTYGDSNVDSVAWSINFESAAPGYNQFLFSSGDGSLWLVATKSAVVGEYYSDGLRDVMASSLNADAHQVKWYRRSNYPHADPLISLRDHHSSDKVLVYRAGGNSLQNNGAWDVYVRAACDASLPPVNGAVGTCTDTLVSGTSCVPTCDAGYVLKGVTSCTDRVLTEVAMCVWQFANRAELKAAVDVCLDAVPSGERCCSSDRLCWHPDPAMRRCGAVGCVDLPDWGTGKVTSMVDLFHDNYQFNQTISSWDVARVERFDRFSKCPGTCQFTGGDLSRWDTSSAKSMASMFEGCSRFNSDISRWDVRAVTDMYNMFKNASVFTADITRWQTDSLVNSSNMFLGADAWRTIHAQCGEENDPYYDDDTCAHHPEKADKYEDHSSGPPGAWTRLVKRWRHDFFFGIKMRGDDSSHEFGVRDGHLSISYDGKRIAAGGTNDTGVYVRVFEWNDDAGWKRAGHHDVVTGAGSNGGIALSGDGRRLAVGDTNGTHFYVSAYHWNAKTSAWDQLGDTLEDTSGPNGAEEFGYAVSFSRDGSRLAVGAPGGSGFTRVFKWDAAKASWSRMGVDIRGPSVDSGLGLGAVVSCVASGSFMLFHVARTRATSGPG